MTQCISLQRPCSGQVALAEDVRSHVEELMGYLVITVRADTPGALLCVQQVRYVSSAGAVCYYHYLYLYC